MHCTCLLLTQSGHLTLHLCPDLLGFNHNWRHAWTWDYMRRRDLITVLAGSAITLAHEGDRTAARADQAHREYSCRQPPTIPYFKLVSQRSIRNWPCWAGASAATCASTRIGPRPTLPRSRKHAIELAELAPRRHLGHWRRQPCRRCCRRRTLFRGYFLLPAIQSAVGTSTAWRARGVMPLVL